MSEHDYYQIIIRSHGRETEVKCKTFQDLKAIYDVLVLGFAAVGFDFGYMDTDCYLCTEHGSRVVHPEYCK